MTATPAPAPATDALLDELIACLQDPDGAAAGLSKMAAGNKAEAEEPEPETKPEALSAGVTKVTRPNGDVYVVRKFGEHDDIKVLQDSRTAGVSVLMYGVPGCGKTAVFEAAFTEEGFYYVPGSGDTEVSDFIGSYIPLPGGDFAWIDGPLVKAMEEGKPLLVDEVALIDPKVMAVVYSVMDGRGELNVTANPSRGVVTAAAGFVVFGACNPNAPGARMSEALLSRFQIHAEVTVDFSLLTKMGVERKIVTAAQNLKTKYDGDEVSWYPAIRELLNFKRISSLMGRDFALANLVAQAPEIDRPVVKDVLSRAVGKTVGLLEVK